MRNHLGQIIKKSGFPVSGMVRWRGRKRNMSFFRHVMKLTLQTRPNSNHIFCRMIREIPVIVYSNLLGRFLKAAVIRNCRMLKRWGGNSFCRSNRMRMGHYLP